MSKDTLLKWSGRKTYLNTEIKKIVDFINCIENKPLTYHEPFLGSASTFIYLKRNKLIENSYLNDSLGELINFYKTLSSEKRFEIFYQEISKEINKHNNRKSYESKKKLYLSWREEFNNIIKKNQHTIKYKDTIRQSVLLYLLNRSCFNGVYRKNPDGIFNVPYGRVAGVDKDKNYIVKRKKKELFNITTLFKKTNFNIGEYYEALTNVNKGDLVYLDPPYLDTVNYYDEKEFGVKEHLTLKKEFDLLKTRGAYGLMSNSNYKQTKKLYLTKGYYFKVILVKRRIQRQKKKTNYKANKSELLISNFELPGFKKV